MIALLSNKAQISNEALIAVGILMFFVVTVLISYNQNKEELASTSYYLEAKRNCSLVSSMINRVMAGGKNFAETRSLSGITIFAETRSVLISDERGPVYCKFSTANVTNQDQQRTFELSGSYRIFNDGENVVFEKQ